MQLYLLSLRGCFQYHHLVPLKGNSFDTLITYIKRCSVLCNVYRSLHIKHIIRGWLLVSKAVQGLYKVPLNCIASRTMLGKKGIHMPSTDNLFPIIFHGWPLGEYTGEKAHLWSTNRVKKGILIPKNGGSVPF